MIRTFDRLGATVVTAICLVAVGACDSIKQHDGWICSSLEELKLDELGRLNADQLMNRCIIKWGYRLSRSPDPARTIADATLAACSGPIYNAQQFRVSNWDESAISFNAKSDAFDRQHPELPKRVRMNMAEELPGESNLEKKVTAEASGLALFSVVQARAGNCKIPEVM